MICKNNISNIYYTYKYDNDNVVLLDELGSALTISYDEWLDQYIIIDKFRNKLTEYETKENGAIRH